MNITIRPLGRGRFAASVCQCILCESKTPFFTAARVLQCEGISDDTPITMTHEGSNIVAMRSNVGEAASRIVVETDEQGPRLKRYRPMSSEMPRQRVRQEARTEIGTSDADKTRAEPEQLWLWDLPAMSEVNSPRVGRDLSMDVKIVEGREANHNAEQPSFFVPHLLGDYTSHSR
jgi:hypothetical protein